VKRSRALAVATCALAATTAVAHADLQPRPVSLVDSQWSCSTKQKGTVVNVTMNTGNADAIHLDAGCTGSIVVHITTATADGIKIHSGVHDLQITGDITCTAKLDAAHQDGIQAMGGKNILIGSTTQTGAMRINCPTGNNGGVWINAGKTDGQLVDPDPSTWPTNVIVDHADVLERNAAVHIGAGSVASRVRNSLLHLGTSASAPPNCIRIDSAAVSPVAESNTCVA
jgi:hypothetical protein